MTSDKLENLHRCVKEYALTLLYDNITPGQVAPFAHSGMLDAAVTDFTDTLSFIIDYAERRSTVEAILEQTGYKYSDEVVDSIMNELDRCEPK